MQPEQECWVLVGMQSERDFGDVRAVVAAVAVAVIVIRGIMFMQWRSQKLSLGGVFNGQ